MQHPEANALLDAVFWSLKPHASDVRLLDNETVMLVQESGNSTEGLALGRRPDHLVLLAWTTNQLDVYVSRVEKRLSCSLWPPARHSTIWLRHGELRSK